MVEFAESVSTVNALFHIHIRIPQYQVQITVINRANHISAQPSRNKGLPSIRLAEIYPKACIKKRPTLVFRFSVTVILKINMVTQG